MEKRFTLNLFYMGLIAALIGVVTTGFVFHTSFMKRSEMMSKMRDI